MNFITDALDELILESGQSEAERSKLMGVYNDIINAIDKDVGFEGGYPTKKWVSGILNQMGHETSRHAMLLKMLKRGEIDADSKEGKEARRYDIMMHVMRDNGMAVTTEPDGNGMTRIVPPSTRPAFKHMRAKVSAFRNLLTTDFNEEKITSDFKKNLHQNIAPEAIKDNMVKIAASSEDAPEFIEISKSMSLEARSLLRRFLRLSGPKDVAETRALRAEYRDSPQMQELVSYGFLDSDLKLNRNKIKKYIEFMQDPQKNGGSNIVLRTQNNTNKTKTKMFQHDRHRATGGASEDKYPSEVDNETTGELDFSDKPEQQADDALNGPATEEQRRIRLSRIRDAAGGTKNSTRNDRARGYKERWQELMNLK